MEGCLVLEVWWVVLISLGVGEVEVRRGRGGFDILIFGIECMGCFGMGGFDLEERGRGKVLFAFTSAPFWRKRFVSSSAFSLRLTAIISGVQPEPSWERGIELVILF